MSQQEWPQRWPLTQAKQTLRGLGIAQSPDQSAATLEWEDDEGHRGTFQPYVCNIPISLWGQDVLEQMSIRLTTETIYSPQSIATGIPYNPQGQGIIERANGTFKRCLQKIRKGGIGDDYKSPRDLTSLTLYI
ncbi:endogenous retrovirus group K member 21 Pro protein-like [Neovison vison]|uniref:endogenous retrovirus group K member 21 Pro protein-like n=1 Tax=Neovison vison TaxID=452646 RepID=UPI001CF08042|nr:endogenous retrovirus group K member 21 Pro protein-like [Neogale vison]